jgi:geranylgeranyl reductase family protein
MDAVIFDVVIVGGGPAGASAASRLAQAGASVAVVDDSHPREKPCGGGVTARALALGGWTVDSMPGGVAVDSAALAHRERSTVVPLDTDGPARLAIVAREHFDRLLLDRACAAGATLHTSRVVSLERTNDAWSIGTRAGVLHSRWVIGADGPSSLVRKRVSEPFVKADLSIASGFYVRGVTSRRVDIEFETTLPGYLWSFPRADHLAVGTCAQADVTSSAQMLAMTSAWLDRHVPAGVRQRYSWPIPSLRGETLARERPAGDGWMLVGDAAGLVDPITREGIYFAMASGGGAAAAIVEAQDPASQYTTWLRDTILAELRLAARLKARFYRPEFIALLITALQRSHRIRRIMADLVAGDQPYHSLRSRLLRTLEWRLMADLFAGTGRSRG